MTFKSNGAGGMASLFFFSSELVPNWYPISFLLIE
jgi:hypothetical protein